MVESYAGRLLVATPLLVDPNFWRTVILVIHHDEEGCVGVVLNRPTDELVVDHLPGWSRIAGDPGVVHFGGPVEPEVAIALATGSQGESTPLEGVVLADVTTAIPDLGSVRIFSGYAGWDAGQLEAEIATGSWYVVPAMPSDPFDSPDEQWRRVLRRQPGYLALVSTFPPDVRLN